MAEKRLGADQVPVAGGGGSAVAYQDAIISTKSISDVPDFLTLPGGLVARLVASGADPFVYSIGSTLVTLTANVNLTVTDNAHNFLWVDLLGILGRSAFPPIYSFMQPGAPSTDQHWFDLGKNVMNRWSGAAWIAIDHIFIGYVRADTGAINARYVCEAVGMTPMERYVKLGNGADGFLDLSAGTTVLNLTKKYTAVVVRGAAKITHTAQSPTLLQIFSQGIIALIGTSGIDMTGLGWPGSPSHAGSPTGGGLGGAGGTGGSGTLGGGHITLTSLVEVPGGGFDGFNNGLPGDPSPLISNPVRRDIMFPYGNGGGRGNNNINAGIGSAGGGYVDLIAGSIAIGATAILKAEGLAGDAGFAQGAGGGGGGGIIQIACRSLVNSGTISVAGGATGVSPGGGGARNGGAGGDGAILRETL